VWDKITAQRSKEEDNANILVLPADYMSPQESAELVNIWLNAQFLENRYEKRLNIIDSWGGL
jgi:ribose 5-phosphate isomerase RpiB